MERIKIRNLVSGSIKDVADKFRDESQCFFTESDIVSYFYRILFDRMSTLQGMNPNELLHQQYPTFFKCDMKNGQFVIKDDNAKFNRGHFDLTILDPAFIKNAKERFANNQSEEFSFITARFWMVKKHRELYLKNPPLFYAFEFMYVKEPINERQKAGIDNLIKLVQQDFKKLKYTQDYKYAENIQMLVFLKDSSEDIRNSIIKQLQGVSREEILCIHNK